MAGEDVELHPRKQEVVLALGDGAAGVEAGRFPRGRAVRGRAHAGSQPSPFERQSPLVDHLHKAGMVDRAVVALEVVLERDLPIRPQLVGDAPAKAQLADVQAVLGHHLGQIAERVEEASASGSRFASTNGPQVPTAIGRSAISAQSNDGSSSLRGAARSDPSRL